MTLSDLQGHYQNLVLLEEAETALRDIRDIQAVNYDRVQSHSFELHRQTEAKALLIEKQLQRVKELQYVIDEFNREQLQPFLDIVYKTSELKLWNYLYLRYVVGYQWGEIADFFHDSKDAVKSRCARYLRTHLQK